jgi:hypothetical protein
MADGIIDPNVVQAGAGVREARFGANVAPIITAIGATAVFGPVGGIALGALHRKSGLLDVMRAEEQEGYAIAEYSNRMGTAERLFQRANQSIEDYGKVVGVSPEQTKLARLQAQNLFDQAMSYDPETSKQASTQLGSLPTLLNTNVNVMDQDALKEQRKRISDQMDVTKVQFDAINTERAMIEGNIDEAFNLLGNDNFNPNDPIQKGRLMTLLGSTVQNAPTLGDALTAVPLIGGMIGGGIKADEVNLTTSEWYDLFIEARMNATGTATQLEEGIRNMAANVLDPQAETLKLVIPGTTATDYITGAAPKFGNAPTEMPANIRNASGGPNVSFGENLASDLSQSVNRSQQGDALGVLLNNIRGALSPDPQGNANEVIERIQRRLPPGHKVGLTPEGDAVSTDTNGVSRPIKLDNTELYTLRRAREARRQEIAQ